jgi:transcriptional regulator with XRE-family HTH domain
MFEDRLKRLREARHLSQREVAEDLGIPQTTYSGYENNKREPDSTILIKIGAYFGVSLDYLLDYHCDNNEKVPPIIDERDLLREKLESLSIKDLEEIDKFMDYLIWKEEQG